MRAMRFACGGYRLLSLDNSESRARTSGEAVSELRVSA